jgi:hypothetical protein
MNVQLQRYLRRGSLKSLTLKLAVQQNRKERLETKWTETKLKEKPFCSVERSTHVHNVP